MTIICPHCSTELNVLENKIDQKIECINCHGHIIIEGNSECNSNMNEEQTPASTPPFCERCGAALPPNAIFCGACGSKVDTILSPTHEPKGSGKALAVKRINQMENETTTSKLSEKFESLMGSLWMAIGYSALSYVIGIFDVREHYYCGRIGLLLVCCGGTMLSIWLTLAILKRRNWARVTFITLTLLMAVIQYKLFSTDGNGFCIFFDCVALVINLYCVILLMSRKMACCFIRCEDGVKRAAIFWVGLVAYCVFILLFLCYYQTSNESEYLNNCAKAAAKGSKGAYQELISYSENSADVSRYDIDRLVQSKKDGNHNSNWKWRGPSPAATYWAAKGGASMLMKIKGVGKVVTVVGVLLCGIGAWFRKNFIDGCGRK